MTRANDVIGPATLTAILPVFVHVWKMSEECKTLALVVQLACESIRFFRL